MTKRRYAQIGLGGRHAMFRNAVIDTYAETSELVALADINPGRLELSQRRVKEKFGVDIPGYAAADFDRMIAETKPDVVIVTTMDATHDRYICRAMELGCDVITEKPMTTDAEKCNRILATQRETGRNVRVTFNYRYSPPRTQLKDMLMSGVIGEILSVDFHWMLDTSHGADYFHRWHRKKENSGGLMVHKATHHFDLVNWWLSSVPERVYASGHRHFYLPQTAERYGLTERGERCHGCAEAVRCPFAVKMADNEGLRELYLDNEAHDGYFRDRCVFSPDIDIEDSMNVVVDYANGVKMTYSLNAASPWEGYMISFNGTRGRIEHKCEESVYINADGSVPGQLSKEGTWTRVFPADQNPYSVEIWEATGGHGGGDGPLLEDVLGAPAEDKYLRAADQRAGAWSIMTGVCANKSMEEGRPVRVDELVPGIEMPDYPPMPTAQDPLPLWHRKQRKKKMKLEKFSFGMGDRFAHQGEAQLAALVRAKAEGIEVTPVWNKSHREHTTIGTVPATVRAEADAAVKAMEWTGSHHVDADHIGLGNVDLFVDDSDFFTLDVADFTGERADDEAMAAFIEKHRHFVGSLAIPGIEKPLDITEETIANIAGKFLLAVQEAGKIYRHIETAKGAGTFVTEVSMDETDDPQTPLDMLFILAAIADEGIPAQTIAPKFTGRFNKGVDYVGDLAQFELEFRSDLAVIAFAVKTFGLPDNLKLSVHSGSDKFSIYPIIGRAIREAGAGLHLKTAGTTWLEEMIGLAEAGNDGLAIVHDVYRAAHERYDELCGPYATVIDIDRAKLPDPEIFATWDSAAVMAAIQHNPECDQYDSNVRQLLHVGYKVAAEMGSRFTDALETHREIIARHVTENIYTRHLIRIFGQ
jgi:predicted dehydrogenase